MSTERDELARMLERTGQLGPSTVECLRLKDAEHYADAILSAGYVKVSEAAIERAAKAAVEHLNERGYAEESEPGYVLVDGTYDMTQLARAVVAALREET
jgi:hypothetical protein